MSNKRRSLEQQVSWVEENVRKVVSNLLNDLPATAYSALLDNIASKVRRSGR